MSLLADTLVMNLTDANISSWVSTVADFAAKDAPQKELGYFDWFLFPLMWLMGWIIKGVHELLVLAGMNSGAGPAWVLGIVGLTLIVRALTVPLFVKQIKGGRAMQMAQPELKAMQEKYRGKRDPVSQQKMMEENRAIQKKYGASMSSSCLPMLVQMPVWFALYRAIYNIYLVSMGQLAGHPTLGGINKADAKEVIESTFFGAPLGAHLIGNTLGGGHAVETHAQRVVIIAMIAYLVITMLIQTKFLTMRNMADDQLNSDNPMVKSTKYMLYFMPFVYILTGPAVQVGLLVYWVTSNTWNMVQQFFLIRHYPMRGSAAARARAPQHEKKFQKFREEQEKKLEAEIENLRANPEGRNAKAVEAKVRDMRRAHLRALAKRRMELGLDEINLGNVDVPEEGGQRMQPGRKGWDKVVQEESEDSDDSEKTNASDGEVRGKDGLTAAERAQKRYEQRAQQRKQAAQKRQNKGKKQKRGKK